MKSSRFESDKNIEENIIFLAWKKLKKEMNDTTIKGVRILFRLKNKNKAIKYRILRDISNLFQRDKADYYKPLKVNNFWNNI